VTNNVSNSNPPYPCTPASFVYLAGELFAPASTASLVTPDGTIRLSAIVQPIVAGAPAPSGRISIMEGEDVVASAPISGRVTDISIPNVTPGPHVFSGLYSGDDSFAALVVGSVTIVAPGSGERRHRKPHRSVKPDEGKGTAELDRG